MKESVARVLFTQLVSGVNALHEKGLFHRDLSVNNLFMAKGLRGEWVLKVGDFGRMIEQQRLPSDSGKMGHQKRAVNLVQQVQMCTPFDSMVF